MQLKRILELLKINKEKSLYHRYINNDHIAPLLENLNANFAIDNVGTSVNNEPIFTIKVGNGSKRILMWSQMHGNESTATKSLFDILNYFKHENQFSNTILKECTLKIIPILNPDGARLYTRVNGNNIDLNRDAQDLSQPESIVLLDVFNDFKPNFCFNLHGQRTIFSAGKISNPATLSFLAPAQDIETTVTKNRKQAMEVVVKMNEMLQQVIPNQIGIYDDHFNLSCVGDTFQSNNVPTILFEAGYSANDYDREQVREYLGLALMTSLNYIANNNVTGKLYEYYFDIPMNEKLFFDIIIRNAKLKVGAENVDIAFQYQEILTNNKIEFIPTIDSIGKLNSKFGHLEIDAKNQLVQSFKTETLYKGYESNSVMINNELFALKPINN